VQNLNVFITLMPASDGMGEIARGARDVGERFLIFVLSVSHQESRFAPSEARQR
jgi:hypothetical protein